MGIVGEFFGLGFWVAAAFDPLVEGILGYKLYGQAVKDIACLGREAVFCLYRRLDGRMGRLYHLLGRAVEGDRYG